MSGNEKALQDNIALVELLTTGEHWNRVPPEEAELISVTLTRIARALERVADALEDRDASL